MSDRGLLVVGGGNYNCSRMGLICYDNFTMLVALLLRVFRLSLSFVSLTVAAAPFVSYTHDAMERIENEEWQWQFAAIVMRSVEAGY